MTQTTDTATTIAAANSPLPSRGRGAGGVRSFPRYLAYRDSGVPWLGAIPAHWQSVALKRLFSVMNGSTPSSGIESYWDGDIVWVTPSDLGQLSGDTIWECERRISDAGYESCGTSLVPAGSLVLSTRAPIGHLAIAGVPLCTNQGCRCLIFRQRDDRRYYYYLLAAARPELQSLGQGSTFQELGKDKLESVYLTRPPLAEQRAIAAFLGRETARIDALVAAKRRLIALLREKRAALISRAVTRGLDASVPLRESGVPWLGAIPARWEIVPLKFVSVVQTGITLGKDYRGRDVVTRPYLRVANVQDGYLDLSDIAPIDVPIEEVARYELRPGDVLMTEGGDPDKLGRGYVWHGQIEGCLHQNHIFAVRPNTRRLDPQFLAALLSSYYGKTYFATTGKQTTNLATTNSTTLGNFAALLPPLKEQQEILQYLDAETENLDALAGRIEEQIARLREYRTALIAAAVTGAIDVRGQVAGDGMDGTSEKGAGG